MRFELTVPLKVHWISSPAHSTTLPPFRVFQLATTVLQGRYQVRSKRVVAWERKIIEQLNSISKPLVKNFSKRLGDHLATIHGNPPCSNQAAGNSSRSKPPRYGRNATGTVTEPSAFWKFSSTATSVRPTARPDPFSVCTSSGLPCALR